VTLCCALGQDTVPLWPGVYMGTGEFNVRGSLVMDWHLIQEGEEILLVTSCYRNWK